jgi:hypothetical protein
MRRTRHEYWQRPTAAAIDALMSSRAAHEHDEPSATATESKLRAFDLTSHHAVASAATVPNLLTFWEVWEAMGERGGFYVRKPAWHDRNRFLVAGVAAHNERPGQKVVLGRYCEGPFGSRASRLSQELDLRCWEFAGVTTRRLQEDGARP